METAFEEKYHDLEKEHYWFKARRNYIVQLLKDKNRNLKILDIGCSSGILLCDLLAEGFKRENLYGVDISAKAIELCKINGLPNTYQMDAQNITIPGPFDIIIASDCLEHLKEDEQALTNWLHLLKPNGMAYIFVPAYMSLWSSHDEVNMHYRRYTRAELKHKLKTHGFEVLRSSYWNFFLFFPVFVFRSISRLWKNKKPASTGDLNKINAFNRPLLGLLNFENKLLSFFKFPFGVSVYGIARKSAA